MIRSEMKRKKLTIEDIFERMDKSCKVYVTKEQLDDVLENTLFASLFAVTCVLETIGVIPIFMRNYANVKECFEDLGNMRTYGIKKSRLPIAMNIQKRLDTSKIKMSENEIILNNAC